MDQQRRTLTAGEILSQDDQAGATITDADLVADCGRCGSIISLDHARYRSEGAAPTYDCPSCGAPLVRVVHAPPAAYVLEELNGTTVQQRR